MRAFAGPVCNNFTAFEAVRCRNCHADVGLQVLHADRVQFAVRRDIEPLQSYSDVPIERMLYYDWQWMSLLFNRVNTAMGKAPLYPFDIRSPGDP